MRGYIAVIAKLPDNVREALKKLTYWTARFLGYSGVIGPMASNNEWADSAKTVAILYKSGLIGREGENMRGKSWLKDRFVGEVVGEYFFGPENNPFRDNELLDYKKP